MSPVRSASRFASSFNDPWFQLDTPLQAAARKQTDLYRYWKEWSPEYESVENAAHALLAEWNKGLREIRAHLQDEKLPDFDRLSEMCEYNLIYHDDLQALWKRIPDQLKISIDPNHPWFPSRISPSLFERFPFCIRPALGACAFSARVAAVNGG